MWAVQTEDLALVKELVNHGASFTKCSVVSKVTVRGDRCECLCSDNFDHNIRSFNSLMSLDRLQKEETFRITGAATEEIFHFLMGTLDSAEKEAFMRVS